MLNSKRLAQTNCDGISSGARCAVGSADSVGVAELKTPENLFSSPCSVFADHGRFAATPELGVCVGARCDSDELERGLTCGELPELLRLWYDGEIFADAGSSMVEVGDKKFDESARTAPLHIPSSRI